DARNLRLVSKPDWFRTLVRMAAVPKPRIVWASARVALFAGVVCQAPLAASPARAAIVWRGDFETGDVGQWNELLNAANTTPPRVTIVSKPVRDGAHAGRIEVRNDNLWSNGLNRVELGHHPDPSKFEGSERYYGWSMMIPTSGTWDAREK